MAELLQGKPVSDEIARNIESRVAALHELGVCPTLALVRVGDRPDDVAYERAVVKQAEALGVHTHQVTLAAGAAEDQVVRFIKAINADVDIHGCLLFRPLPPHLDEERVCNALAATKDVDGITSASLARVFTGSGLGFPPSTADACLKVLDYYGVPLEGARVAVVGRSLVVGRPLAMMLLARHATVTLCHSRTSDVAAVTREADVAVFASGRPKHFGAEYVRPGQVIIDVGINFDAAGVMCGDVDDAAVEPIVRAITPVPGGVGTVTTAMTLLHTVEAAEVAAREQTDIAIERLM
ncbi:bifunctional 5,10-methylene-tetrahydrofolate dehydrogenase/5,10-methylene-tetrahydrofolate cyclohydrolase [Eggerthellaceae bacterium zg-887]|uniref:bifunctional 5,10-methylenetetrahydrofolate dehydrogenase/5,10-methenyltetrahydrofolate cyclohydrolase n=1 Tax=Xiamenia xianingshaonis TaxID=2682776 RepID=UPI00140B46C7|nr:bifunctional 5,10-methylenetetrahydrofolate dehydrogenase/5,10-methenyltetrahydrofolate cyclohydrolase [Xiamenia xianingshaonis]NHM15068.1 bifunctional 5,10-methylene-tetrahydrofolate dehydrogenase/5,10-methylene-tetrahydrofolate cyclohydrolase [Xiamenia xianingshaonis]